MKATKCVYTHRKQCVSILYTRRGTTQHQIINRHFAKEMPQPYTLCTAFKTHQQNLFFQWPTPTYTPNNSVTPAAGTHNSAPIGLDTNISTHIHISAQTFLFADVQYLCGLMFLYFHSDLFFSLTQLRLRAVLRILPLLEPNQNWLGVYIDHCLLVYTYPKSHVVIHQ